MEENQTLPAAGQFQIRVRKGGWEVEVAGPDKNFVLEESTRLIEQFSALPESIFGENQAQPGTQTNKTSSRFDKSMTINEFYRQFKSISTHGEKMLVLGYWLEMVQGQPYFTIEDIVAKYKEAREQPPANMKRDMGNVVVKGFFRQDKGEEGALNYSLTNSGLREVESKMSAQ